MRDRKRRSKTKNGVFRSGFFDQKKKLSYLKKSYIFFSDRKIQIEKRRFSFSICVFDLALSLVSKKYEISVSPHSS